MVINPRFSIARGFHLGLAAAATGENQFYKSPQLGYINRSGNFVISEQFQRAENFDEATGLAVVCVSTDDDPRCGYIGTSGKFVINPQFYFAGDFRDGLAYIIEKKGASASYIDRTGHIVWKGEEPTVEGTFDPSQFAPPATFDPTKFAPTDIRGVE